MQSGDAQMRSSNMEQSDLRSASDSGEKDLSSFEREPPIEIGVTEYVESMTECETPPSPEGG
jgi:hypothetical protein